MPIEPDDVILNKAAIIERCIRRIHEEHRADPGFEDQTHVDALTLNVERACQAAIDMAMHVVAARRLGVPQSSADAFSLLVRERLIPSELGKALRAMAGFHNVALYHHEDLDPSILHHFVQTAWSDLAALCQVCGVSIHCP
jgi:uncharacterized protein YutE (UPF0331/DUF86 family)